MDYLESDDLINFPVPDRSSLWSKLVDLVRTHRRFADAKWAMNQNHIDRIAALTERLAPESAFLRHKRLFGENDFELFETRDDYQRQWKDLEKKRQIATQEIAADDGINTVLEFAEVVESPWRVGIAYSSVAPLDMDSMVFQLLFEPQSDKQTQFAGGFVRGRLHIQGWAWVDNIEMSQWQPDDVGRFFALLPFTPDTWERVMSILGGDQSTYWSQTSADPYEAKANLAYAVDQLIAYGRPRAAIRCLHKISLDKQRIDPQQAVRALLDTVRSSEPSTSMDAYEIGEVIKELQNAADTNPDDLFRVEWAYLPLLDAYHDASPRLLSQRLSSDPMFFCEVIRLVFRSKKEEHSSQNVTDERRNIATNAYRLLDKWHLPPGLRDDGTYDGNSLKEWANVVKEECARTGHLEVAMTMFGHVLTYVPADPGGLWIHNSAAELLNMEEAQHLRSGFGAQLFNSRGVHWVDPTGNPEKELASKYREQADAVETAGYHRLAITLRELAKSYDYEAERLSSRGLLSEP